MNRLTQERLWSRDFVNVCITYYFMVFNYQYLLVTLPLYFQQDLKGPDSQAGLIVAVFFVAAIAIRPFTGAIIERAGIRNVFYLSVALYVLPNLLYFAAASIPVLLALRALHGFAFGMLTTAMGTIAANIVPESRKGEGMGYFGLMVSISMATGPFAGLTIFYGWGSTAMFGAALGSVVLGMISAAMISRPDANAADNARGTAAPASGAGAQPAPAANKWGLSSFFEAKAMPISIPGFIFGFAYSTIVTFIPIYAEHLNLSRISNLYFVVFAGVLLLTRPFTGRWFDRYGENVIMYPTIISYTAGLALLSIADNPLLFLLSAALVGFGWGTIFPSSQTIAVKVSPPARRGVATATFLFFLDSGVIIGAMFSGMIGATIGYSTMYVYSSVLVLIGLAVYYIMHGRKQTRRQQAAS